MLIQTPSIIFKNDFRKWYSSENLQHCEIISEKNLKVQEFLLKEFSLTEIEIKPNYITLIIPLYGLIKINEKIVSANEVFSIKPSENKSITIKNLLDTASNYSIIEIKDEKELTFENFSEINVLRNALSKISNHLKTPNYIGIFDGREEIQFHLENHQNKIFAMVLNGAFEIQNRLLENRDAIILWEITELEFEALSENALIIFFEI
ncbi:hypothetical protein [Cloacibacterium sp.]|uniref:pirin family protein n=1 Tax=Cloacibacterium sp. TaxID=1913682 RepID=UPI0039E368AD